MKRVLLAAVAALFVSSSTGCCLFDCFGHAGCASCCGKCGPYPGCGAAPCGQGGDCGPACGPGGCGPACANRAPDPMEDGSAFAGPPTGGVTYPYYTTRGPRDFLASRPRGIGPNP